MWLAVSHQGLLVEGQGAHLGPWCSLKRWGDLLTARCRLAGGPAGRHPLPGASGAHFLPAAAKIAGLYNDSEPPRKTMRRGVLMTLLQQSAMTLPLWIGKPGDK